MNWDRGASGLFRHSVGRLAAALDPRAHADPPVPELSESGLGHSYLQFVETMAQALDARDPYTAGHSIRVGAYADAIARALGVPAADLETLRIAAQLHDIGKIGVPDAVLQKPGKLTPEEFAIIKQHPQIGRRILEKVARFDAMLPAVELHHENYDGTGYPYGMAGDRVPLFARIVRVADAFDSMMTNRNYRQALSLDAVIQELRKNSGTQFDPQIAAVMIQLVCRGEPFEIASPRLRLEPAFS